MPRIDAKSLLSDISRLKTEVDRPRIHPPKRRLIDRLTGTITSYLNLNQVPGRLRLPMRQHDDHRLPVSPFKPESSSRVRTAMQLLQDFRNQLRTAEEMVAKLGFSMREIQVLKKPTRGSFSGEDAKLASGVPAPVRILRFQRPRDQE